MSETVGTTAGTGGAATELARVHDEIDRLAIRIATLDPGYERTEVVHEACARFILHGHAEELYLYPAVHRYLPNGPVDASAQMCRHRAVARTIDFVERMTHSRSGSDDCDDEFDILVGQLVVGIQDHVEQLDAVILPALYDACSVVEFTRLGEQLADGLHIALDDIDGAEPRRRGTTRLLRRVTRSGR